MIYHSNKQKLRNLDKCCCQKVPIAVSVSLYEAICLFKGTRVLASKGKEITTWKPHILFLYCCCGILAGIVGGLLGLGGGFILGPLFLELGIPPQVPFSFFFLNQHFFSLPSKLLKKVQ